jgi:tetratricopeptide (TPR) repeat protein
VVCSPNSAKSTWVNEEIKQFKMLGRADKLLCMLVDDPQYSFPASVLTKFDASGVPISGDLEPLAADARDGFDGKEIAKLKIIAGMIDVGLDELIHRDASRRHRRMLAMVVAAVAGMALTSGLSIYALNQRDLAQQQQIASVKARDAAIASRNVAEQAQAESEQVVDFLVGMFELFDPRESLGNVITAKDVLDRAREKSRIKLTQQPLTHARLVLTLGSVYQGLGLLADARELKEDAYQIRRKNLGSEHADTLDALNDLSDIAGHQGEYAAMQRYSTESLRINLKLNGRLAPATIASLSDLSIALWKLGKRELALKYSEEVLNTARQTPTVKEAELESYVRYVAINLSTIGENDRAEPLYKESLVLSRKVYGELAPNVAYALDNLALHYLDTGRNDLAEPLFWESLEMLRQIFGDKHPEVAQTMGNVAAFLYESGGDLDKARQLLQDALAIDREIRPQHEFIATYLGTLALIDTMQNDLLAAELNWRESIAIYEYSFSAFDPIVLWAQLGLSDTLIAQNKMAEAQAILTKSYDELHKLDNHQYTLMDVLDALILLYEKLEKPTLVAQFQLELENLDKVMQGE